MLRAAHSANNLYDLVDKSRRHEYQVPEFQRDLVWRPEQVRELLVSLVQGHYAGALLVLEFDPTNPPFAHREIYGTGPLPSSPTSTKAYSVLDGQQRISAVYYAFQHPNLPLPPSSNLPPSSKKRLYRFFLKLDKLLSGDFDEAVLAEPVDSSGFKSAVADWIARKTIPFGAIDSSLLPSHASGLITLWDLLEGGLTAAGSLLLSFLGVRSPLNAASLLSALLPLLTYEFDVIALSPSFPTPPTRPTPLVSFIAPLFVNVNSKGTRLTLFDLAVAHLFPVLHPRINLRSLWEELPKTHPGLGTLIAGRRRWIDPDDLLRIMALITGGSVKKADLLDHLHGVATDLTSGKTRSSPVGYTFASFSDLWNEAASCLEEACNRVINDYKALRPEWIPYTSMLIPLAALIHVEKRSGAPGARKKVDCWYWHSVFYERYEKSVDTTAMADFNQVTNWILGTSGKPSWISGAVPPGLDLKVVDEPQSAIFKAVLNLFALAEARNLLNGDPPGTDLELDHLFPKDGAKPWSGHRWINSVLNFTLLEPSVNKKKKSKDPDIFYHSDMLPGHAASGRPVRDTCQSHLIGPGAEKVFSGASSASPSAVGAFEQFIEEREKDVLYAIKELLSPC